jgi:hypothetical protein
MNWIGMLIGAGIGALLGWALKCPGNTCPITSHWWVLPLVGAIFGLTWVTGKKPGTKDSAEPPEQGQSS